MKKIKLIGVIILLTIIVTSCKKWIDPDINKDPNKPTDVSMALLMPSAQTGLGYAVGGDVKYAASMWMQQMAGGANQPLAYDRYVFTQSDVDNMWKWAMYAGCMKDMSDIMKKAEEMKAPWYGGIAKIMMAYSLGVMTDLWDKIPYSEAFQGDGDLTPAYDDQQKVYATINTLLDGAITDLSQPEGANLYWPGGEDFIYAGDPAMWTMAAYSLKARFALHLAKRNGATAYTDALAALANGFTGNSDDMVIPFGSAYNEQNPMFQFSDQRPGDIVVGAYLVDSMIAHADPRLPLFVDTTGGAAGSHAGLGEGASLWGPYYASANSPVPLITYVELKFIEAEARFQTADLPGAATAHNDAVAASLAKFGLTDPAYIAAYGSETAASITLEKIITQKYFALCYQLEVYNDYRRTGYPVLVPATNGVISAIPKRYPYPTSERLYNGENCPDVNISTKVWWDN